MSEKNRENADKKWESAHKFSVYFYNSLTYAGATLALLVFFIECILFALDFFSPSSNVYLGLITYAILPPFLILGLVLIPVGAWNKRRRVLRGTSSLRPRTFFIDPSISTHRNAIVIFVTGTIILVVMTAIGSYKAFHYTESVQFCGTTCHNLMTPQFTRYRQSSHARVKCVECHIGAGADWYVRSKISGVRQIFKTIQNTYPRPIPTPVHNLRPAEETCQQCHWPDKFFSSFEMRRQYFLSSEKDNPGWSMRMLIHVGGKGTATSGIHAHMYMDNDVYYVADDERRQVISWVKTIDKQGKETIYTAPDSPYKDKQPPAQLVRKMDCIDCHNRPTHRFEPPDKLLNAAMAAGLVDPRIPAIKHHALEVLSANYETTQQAERAIREKLTGYYQKEFGESFAARKAEVDRAIEQVVVIYKNNFFPEMKSRWDAFPDNIGHMVSPGCFRCHDDKHTSAQGKTIPRDCTTCHTIIEQGPPGALEKNIDGLPFKHPVDISDMWQEMNCFDCHTGGPF